MYLHEISRMDKCIKMEAINVGMSQGRRKMGNDYLMDTRLF